MIDASKIRPGDTGTIRVMFGSEAGEFVAVAFGTMDDAIFSQQVPASIIASHTPSPWVPEPGDVVRWDESPIGEWRVRAVDGDEAWLWKYASGNAFARLSSLTLIRKGAA